MTEYVAGFLFDINLTDVLLITKARPEWQAGSVNGIGGHVEPGETPHVAVEREFHEETGLQIRTWELFAVLVDQEHDGKVHFFRATIDRRRSPAPMASADEPVHWYSRHFLPPNIRPNLAWLIPMALSMDRESAAWFIISEVY